MGSLGRHLVDKIRSRIPGQVADFIPVDIDRAGIGVMGVFRLSHNEGLEVAVSVDPSRGCRWGSSAAHRGETFLYVLLEYRREVSGLLPALVGSDELTDRPNSSRGLALVVILKL